MSTENEQDGTAEKIDLTKFLHYGAIIYVKIPVSTSGSPEPSYYSEQQTLQSSFN